MKTKSTIALAIIITAVSLVGCGKSSSTNKGDRTANALASYVAPGEKDEYYLFYSGGHSGQVFVAGIPSLRHIVTIPVFAPYPGTGYGFDEESKKMLGDFTWGDMHHPALSQTDSKYDGRWLFVNDNANNRIARIDLHDFKTHQILGPIPNSIGNHGSSFITENSRIHSVCDAFLGAAAERTRGRSERLRKGIQRHGQRDQSRSANGRDESGLANPDAAVRLGPRFDRQGPEQRLGVLDELQHGNGARRSRSELEPERSRSVRCGELARRRKSGRRWQSRR